jgi:hypothetical protein
MNSKTLSLISLFVFGIFATSAQAQNNFKDTAILDLRPNFGPVKNQLDRSTCATFSTIAAIEYAYRQKYNSDINFSEQYSIYCLKQYTDRAKEDEASIYECFATIKQNGLLQEMEWPYANSYFNRGYPCYNDTYGTASSALDCYSHPILSQSLKSKTIKVPIKLIRANANRSKSVVKWLQKEQLPLIFYFPQTDANWGDSGTIFMNDSLYALKKTPYYHITLICGFDLNKKVFFVRNQWGATWGQNGYGTLSFDMFDKYALKDCYAIKIKDETPMNITPMVEVKPTFESAKIENQLNENGTLTIKLSGHIHNLGHHSIEVRSIFLVTNAANETKEVMIPKNEIPGYKDLYARVVKVKLADSTFNSHFDIESLNGEELQYTKEVLQSPTLQQLLEYPANKIQIKTSVYILGDAWGYEHHYRVIQDIDSAMLRKP